jgi:hypothetical protein
MSSGSWSHARAITRIVSTRSRRSGGQSTVGREIVEPIHHLVVAIGHHDNGFAPGAVVAEEVRGTRPEHRGVALEPQFEHDQVCLLGEVGSVAPWTPHT